MSQTAFGALNLRPVHGRNEVVTGRWGRAGFYLMVKDYSNENKPLLYVIGLKYPNWMQILDRGCLTGLGKDCLPVSKQSENHSPFPGRQLVMSPVAFGFGNCTKTYTYLEKIVLNRGATVFPAVPCG